MRRLWTNALLVGASLGHGPQVRTVVKIPNKGVKEIPDVPDRLRDAFNYFGTDATKQDIDPESTGPYLPESQRHGLLKDVLSNSKNLVSYGKLDRLALAIEQSRYRPPGHHDWTTVMVMCRTSNFCMELVRHPSDIMPPGEKLWIDLGISTERRMPYVLEIEDGTLVLPIFTMETHLSKYFQETNSFHSTWFPHPRMGTQKDPFSKQEFPVCCFGNIHKIAMMATVAVPNRKLICLINPFTDHSKFLTYQELLNLAKAKDAQGNIMRSADALQRAFDSRRWKGKRIDPATLPPLSDREKNALVPYLAKQELRLLIFDHQEVKGVYVQSRDTPKWRQWITKASAKNIVISLVVDPSYKGDDEQLRERLVERLGTWSFLTECDESDFNVTLSATVPTEATENTYVECVYDQEQDSKLLIKSCFSTDSSLREKLDYDAPFESSNAIEEQLVREPSLNRQRRPADGGFV